MKTYSVSIEINAAAEIVWNVLTDAASWTSWNPTIESIAGEIRPQHKLRLCSKLMPNRPFPVFVRDFEPPTRMVWVGGMPFGLFKGVRSYTLSPTKDGIRFSMIEEFSGPLARFVLPSMPDLQPSFDEFAAALKRQAERFENSN